MSSAPKSGTPTRARRVNGKADPGAVERRVTRGSVELAVFEYGDPANQTVVLAHGWPDTHHLWEGVVPHLVDRFHVVSYDQRGHGQSSDPGHFRGFTLAELALDFMAVVDAVSPDEPVHVLAHDWGSVQVWEAVCEPEAELRIASFTSVSGPNLDAMSRWFRRGLSRPTPGNLAGPLSQLASSGYTFFFQAPLLPRLAFAATNRERWKGFLKVSEGTPTSQVHLADTFEQDMVSGLRIYRANIFHHLFGAGRERSTRVPVQLIVNTKDVAVRPSGYDDYGRHTDRLWRRDVSSGHWVPFSRPALLARAVTELADHL
ncbi:MAG TPA: alpha/beta fold hydrolase, partial [Nocardioidaceae bacterium]|nr:alpha/beta fold hydrolase [Nocardioidaceae bacterium]